MKTEHEQIEAMAKLLCDRPCSNICRYDRKICDHRCVAYERAKKLIKADYGDVSEYKEEIQRLKDNEFAVVEICNQTMRDTYKKTLIEIKQAKIDVLNMVKSAAARLSATEVYHIYNLVNELIKEVEGQ